MYFLRESFSQLNLVTLVIYVLFFLFNITTVPKSTPKLIHTCACMCVAIVNAWCICEIEYLI